MTKGHFGQWYVTHRGRWMPIRLGKLEICHSRYFPFSRQDYQCQQHLWQSLLCLLLCIQFLKMFYAETLWALTDRLWHKDRSGFVWVQHFTRCCMYDPRHTLVYFYCHRPFNLTIFTLVKQSNIELFQNQLLNTSTYQYFLNFGEISGA